MKINSINQINYPLANQNIIFKSKNKRIHTTSSLKTLDAMTIMSTPMLSAINCKNDGIKNNKNILSTKEGYNKIARVYDTWKWQSFWEANEMPLIMKWSENKKNSYGADIGVGTGRNLKIFLANNNKIDGFDISNEMITICKQKYSDYVDKNMLNCYNLSVFDINNSNNKYDWIISNRVMSNIEDVKKFIQVLQNIIKVGGECFISDVHPNRNYDYTHINIANNDVYIETYKHPIHLLKQLFKEYNFEIKKYEEFFKDNLKHTDTIKTDTKPIFYYFILKYKGKP